MQIVSSSSWSIYRNVSTPTGKGKHSLSVPRQHFHVEHPLAWHAMAFSAIMYVITMCEIVDSVWASAAPSNRLMISIFSCPNPRGGVVKRIIYHPHNRVLILLSTQGLFRDSFWEYSAMHPPLLGKFDNAATPVTPAWTLPKSIPKFRVVCWGRPLPIPM
jgi:hypothetical protein